MDDSSPLDAKLEEKYAYGTRLLKNMGWSGKGLGSNEDGIAEPIKPRKCDRFLGVGFYERQNQWVAHQDNFNDLLRQLNDGQEADSASSKKEFSSLEKKSKSSRNRVHYHKFTRGKDLSRCTEEDMLGILGKSRSETAGVVDECADGASKLNGPLFVKSPCDSVEYFSKRLAQSKRAVTELDDQSLTAIGSADAETEMPKTKKRRSKKVSFKAEVEAVVSIEDDAMLSDEDEKAASDIAETEITEGGRSETKRKHKHAHKIEGKWGLADAKTSFCSYCKHSQINLEDDVHTTCNSEPAVIVEVFRKRRESPVEIATEVDGFIIAGDQLEEPKNEDPQEIQENRVEHAKPSKKRSKKNKECIALEAFKVAEPPASEPEEIVSKKHKKKIKTKKETADRLIAEPENNDASCHSSIGAENVKSDQEATADEPKVKRHSKRKSVAEFEPALPCGTEHTNGKLKSHDNDQDSPPPSKPSPLAENSQMNNGFAACKRSKETLTKLVQSMKSISMFEGSNFLSIPGYPGKL